MINVLYRPKPGAPVTRLSIEEDRDVFAVMDKCRALIYPDVAPQESLPRGTTVAPVNAEVDGRARRLNGGASAGNGTGARARGRDEPPGPSATSERAATTTNPAGAASPGVRDTSLSAYDRLRASGALGAQERLVYDLVRGSGELNRDWTRQEIARELAMGINAVCGRVHALIHEHGLLEERARRACTVTGESANPVTAVEAP